MASLLCHDPQDDWGFFPNVQFSRRDRSLRLFRAGDFPASALGDGAHVCRRQRSFLFTALHSSNNRGNSCGVGGPDDIRSRVQRASERRRCHRHGRSDRVRRGGGLHGPHDHRAWHRRRLGRREPCLGSRGRRNSRRGGKARPEARRRKIPVIGAGEPRHPRWPGLAVSLLCRRCHWRCGLQASRYSKAGGLQPLQHRLRRISQRTFFQRRQRIFHSAILR